MVQVLKFPHPLLRDLSTPVSNFDDALHSNLNNMAHTMYSNLGVGLAAPQIGILERYFVIDISTSNEERNLHEFINPEIVTASGTTSIEEGCLSLPDVSVSVSRNNHLIVHYQNRQGRFQQLECEGLLSVAIQHEIDHLNGRLLIDYLPMVKRALVKRRLEKASIYTS